MTSKSGRAGTIERGVLPWWVPTLAAQRMASDVDLVILTNDPNGLADSSWFSELWPGSRLIRVKRWGPVRERRYRLRSGLLVELNFAPLDWAAVPLDAGTQRALSDGHRIICDTGLLEVASAGSRAPDGLSV